MAKKTQQKTWVKQNGRWYFITNFFGVKTAILNIRVFKKPLVFKIIGFDILQFTYMIYVTYDLMNQH